MEARLVGNSKASGRIVVNKSEFIEKIATTSEMSKSEANRLFDAFEGTLTETLKSGEEIRITGFGKFYVREQSAREGRNPQTGEKMRIKASKTPAFSPGKAFKEAI